jgi:hypothetical protein
MGIQRPVAPLEKVRQTERIIGGRNCQMTHDSQEETASGKGDCQPPHLSTPPGMNIRAIRLKRKTPAGQFPPEFSDNRQGVEPQFGSLAVPHSASASHEDEFRVDRAEPLRAKLHRVLVIQRFQQPLSGRMQGSCLSRHSPQTGCGIHQGGAPRWIGIPFQGDVPQRCHEGQSVGRCPPAQKPPSVPPGGDQRRPG